MLRMSCLEAHAFLAIAVSPRRKSSPTIAQSATTPTIWNRVVMIAGISQAFLKDKVRMWFEKPCPSSEHSQDPLSLFRWHSTLGHEDSNSCINYLHFRRSDPSVTTHVVLHDLIFSDTSLWYAVPAGLYESNLQGMRISSATKGIYHQSLADTRATPPAPRPIPAATQGYQPGTCDHHIRTWRN